MPGSLPTWDVRQGDRGGFLFFGISDVSLCGHAEAHAFSNVTERGWGSHAPVSRAEPRLIHQLREGPGGGNTGDSGAGWCQQNRAGAALSLRTGGVYVLYGGEDDKG